ncbi:unnamed protein product [Hymenolepis diminuta]|uniref:Nipped-B protein n=1 Tax=Hymenolepis diminuta TaxID=6216 RepID=A0A564Z813_HYMDI|nr:unnamed protein product [Hymenolepis diminuta]
MLGDIGRIPIISLSGCKSLSDILSELPLPQPLPKTVSGPELIDDPRVYQEAQNLLQSHNDFLVESLSSTLASTSTDGIVLKNDQPNAPIDFHTLPPVLKDAITKMPNILEENRSFKCIYSSKEVLQILNKEVGKSSAKLTSPTKSISSSNARHQPATTGPTVAPVKLTLKQPQPPGEVSGSGTEGIYSVTAVEPLKLSIKRASILPHTQETSKRSKMKRRSKNSSSTSGASNPLSNSVISGNQNIWPINPAESLKPQSVPGAQVPIPIHTSPCSIVQQSSRHHQLLPTAVVAPVPPGLPNPSPSVQLVIPPPPPTTSSTSRKSGQLLSNVFNQLLHSSEQDSTIASLLSSSDGQSTGTPTSMDPSFHPRSPPLSVPSNCSYPATPGMNSSSLSVNNPNVGSVGPVPDPSPINAIFDTTAGTNADLSDGRGDSNPQPAVPPQPPPPPPPRGLAAYLQKSRYHHAEVVASPEEGDAYARQHGSVPPMSSSASSPWTERRSGVHAGTASNVGAGIYPTSSSSLTSTPNGQEAGSKEKRGRRRKSELEGLINWQVRDQTTPLKKQHGFHSHQILPILENNSPQHPSASHHSSRGNGIPSDNEGISGFTEPLGERVKRRRQQHKTPPLSVSGGADTIVMNKAPMGKSGSGSKNSGSKRAREDTLSEVSLSPKRERRGRPPRHRQILSSEESEEEDRKIGGGGDGRQDQDDNASVSSCLTDSPVPRKHSLQRLVEEFKGRPPSLPRIDNLRSTPMSSTPVPTNEHVTSHSPSRERLKKISSVRSSASPPPLLPLQHDSSSADTKERHRRLKKRRQIHQPPFSSDEEDEIRGTPRKSSHCSMLVADQLPPSKHNSGHSRITEVSSPSSQMHRKRRKTVAINLSSSSTISSTSQSSSSSSEDFKSASFDKQQHQRQRRRRNTSHSSQEEKPPIQRMKRELTPSTDPCTDSSEYEACEADGFASSFKYDEPLSDLSDSDRAEMIVEAEKRIAEEVAKFAATATGFSNHISEFLLRVGGLDLLKYAGEMSMTTVDPVGGRGDSATMVDQTPVEARLSRREVNALYNEAEEVRVAGSISDEPSGRLVRFLNLLRVHIRDASSLMAPNPTTADFKDLIQRRKARLERRSAGGSGNSDNTVGNRELVSEALLWSHPVWMRVLRGLDSALIALHIIAGPDVPRGRLLAMEELVESITTITQFHFNQLTSAIHTPPSDSKRSSSNIASDLTNIARESLGTRLSESLTGLASLVRLHPTRFTDSLIIHLTELAILVISCGLSSGTYRRSPPPGSSINAAIASVIYPEPAPTPISGEPEERWERRQAVYRERNTWRLQLQRSALALVSTIFLQYDKHRHMVAADILNSLIFSPLKAASNTSSNKAAASTFTKKRNFWVLASGSFLNDWTPFCQGSQSTTTSNMVANGHFLRVHPFTAVLMALIQGLIPAPSYVCGGSGRRSSSACAPATPSSGVSQQSTTTGTGMSEQYGIPDTNQLVKEEKAISTGYTNAILTSQYFVTDIFRKVNAKGEENFRPLIETVITDLLRVAADAPVEWPVASLILSVFGQSFMQHVNSPSSTNTNSSRGPGAQGNSTSSSRSADPNTRAIALECLITLASGMYQLEKIRNLARKTGGGDIIEVRSALSAFLSSPVLGLYNLTLTTDDAPNIITPVDHVKQREFAFKLISRLRYTYFDGLSLAAKRFHLVTWLHEINQELTSTNPGPSDERRKQLEEIRKNLLIEFASTHHSISGIAPWLPPPRGAGILSTNGGAMSVSGGGGGGSGGTRAGLISPAASEPSVAWASGPLSDTKLALYTGYGMGADSRRKKIARAHRLATKIVAKYSHMPIGFDVLYMQIVKMVHDPSLAIRTRAIRGLSTLVEICPECIPVPAVKEENPGNLNASDLISIIPLRLMDNSPMVREAAVELVARLVKIPTSRNSSVFLARLFKHLINRVLDLQISVRKRAIKSLQNLLLLNQHSDHTEESRCTSQTPLLSSKQKFEACVTLLRRSNDEESIKKIVLETFTSLWFTPLSTSDPSKLAARLEKHARNLCEIVLHVRNRVAGVVEDFMKSILNQEGPEKAAQVDAAASQIVEFLVKMIQRCHNANWHSVNCQFHPKHHRENASSSKPNCECSSQPPDGLSPSNTFLLLSMIAKPRPQLLLQHIPFIVKVVTSIMPPNNGSVPDGNALSYAIEIIEPCCFHVASKGGIYLSQLFPNGTVLLEDCLIYLLQRHCRVVVDASLSCLATIVNHLTKDYTRVAVCFANFYECLIQEKKRKLPIIKPTSSSMSSSNSLSVRCHWRARPKVLRAVYTVGLICKLFSLQDLANAAFELVSLPKGDSRLPPDIDISILTHQVC